MVRRKNESNFVLIKSCLFSIFPGLEEFFFSRHPRVSPAFLALFSPRMAIHLFFEKGLSLSLVHTFFTASVLHLQLYGIFQLLAKGGARSGGVSFISL